MPLLLAFYVRHYLLPFYPFSQLAIKAAVSRAMTQFDEYAMPPYKEIVEHMDSSHVHFHLPPWDENRVRVEHLVVCHLNLHFSGSKSDELEIMFVPRGADNAPTMTAVPFSFPEQYTIYPLLPGGGVKETFKKLNSEQFSNVDIRLKTGQMNILKGKSLLVVNPSKDWLSRWGDNGNAPPVFQELGIVFFVRIPS